MVNGDQALRRTAINDSLLWPTRQGPTITYHLVKGARFFDSLVARIGNREHTILGETADMCLGLPDQRDYDGDGTRDALVFHSTACRGNEAPGVLFFVSGDKTFAGL